MTDVQPLSADELADYDAQLVDCGIYYLTATDLARLLYTIKWLQGERDAWEREAEAHDETIADRDARIAELEAAQMQIAAVVDGTGFYDAPTPGFEDYLRSRLQPLHTLERIARILKVGEPCQ